MVLWSPLSSQAMFGVDELDGNAHRLLCLYIGGGGGAGLSIDMVGIRVTLPSIFFGIVPSMTHGRVLL